VKSLHQLPLAAALCVGALFATGASAATTIETLSAWDGSDSVSPWGTVGTQVYGQSITAPAGASLLTGFSFRIKDIGSPINFAAHVYAWDGAKITGPALFNLGGQSIAGGASGSFLPVSIATSVAVTPGSQYMMFLSTIDEPQSTTATSWGYLNGADAYAGGGFFFFNTNSFASLSADAWENFGGKDDLAFSASFDGTTVVPVPGALGLMLSGAAAMGFLGRRRRKA